VRGGGSCVIPREGAEAISSLQMPRCRVDTSISRQTAEGFDFPLGVYPVERMSPREGYTVAFEQADAAMPEGGDAEGADLPEWPDRYVFDIVVKSSRVEAISRQLFALLPGRVFPILDLLGNDAYREIDPYIAYDLVGIERFLECAKRFRPFFYEDGMVGFGAMSEEPFFYVFVDEHKIITVRAPVESKDRVDALLAAFDLKPVEHLAGADSALHEHRNVLESPGDRPDLLTAEEIVEELIDSWGLELNIDPSGNFDSEGIELGITPWRCITRMMDDQSDMRYRESLVTASTLSIARELATDDALSAEGEETLSAKPLAESADESSIDAFVLAAERLKADEFAQLVDSLVEKPGFHGRPSERDEKVVFSRWLD